MSQPIVIAHRGGAAVAPENTLEAFQRGLALGADGVEFDLQLTGDGELVVTHDPLQPDEACPDAPRLAQALERIAALKPDATLVIDLKATPWKPGCEEQGQRLVEAAASVLETYPHPERLVLASFDWDAAEYAQRLVPAARIGFHTLAVRWTHGLSPRQTGVDDPRELLAYLEAWRQARGPGFEARSALELMRDAGARIWSCHHRDLTPDAIARARDLGLAVWTWTVNSQADLDRVLGLGVDAITTDWPGHVVSCLATGHWSA